MTAPEFRRGRKPGDVRVRVDRPHTRYFRYVAPGVFTAKLAADEPTTPGGRAWAATKRALFGRPLSTEQELEERLPKWKALPCLLLRRDVVRRLRHAGEPLHAARRRDDRLRLAPADLGRDRGRPRPRHALVPPDDPGLPQRRRQLHRGARQPRGAPRPGRRGGAADRLRADRRRQRLRRRPGAVLAVPAAAAPSPCP